MKDIKITNNLPLDPPYYGPKANPLNCDYGRSLCSGPGSRHFSSHSDISLILCLNAVNTAVASSYRSNLSALSPLFGISIRLGCLSALFFFLSLLIFYFLICVVLFEKAQELFI